MFYERQSLRDASEHDACDGEWVQSYRQVSRGSYRASFELMTVGDAVISRERIAPSVAQETRSPAGKLSFIFPITAQGGWRVNGHHEMGTMVALRQGETELMTVVGEESDLISLTLPVEAIGLSTGGSSVRSRTRSPADEALGDWLSCLLGFGALEGRPSADLERVLPDLLAERFLDFWAAFDEHSKQLTSRRASLDLFRRVERHIADDPANRSRYRRSPVISACRSNVCVPPFSMPSACRRRCGCVWRGSTAPAANCSTPDRHRAAFRRSPCGGASSISGAFPECIERTTARRPSRP